MTTALCHGLTAISKVTIAKLTPFFALLGPQVAVQATDVDGFSLFYNELFRSWDIPRAKSHLSPAFRLYLSEELLVRGFVEYIRANDSSNKRRPRVEGLLTEERQRRPGAPLTSTRKRFKELVKPSAANFEKFQRQFLMSDHPDNQGRFACTFDLAMEMSNKHG